MKHHFVALSLCVVWVTLTGCIAADVNGDGVVNVLDLVSVAEMF